MDRSIPARGRAAAGQATPERVPAPAGRAALLVGPAGEEGERAVTFHLDPGCQARRGLGWYGVPVQAPVLRRG